MNQVDIGKFIAKCRKDKNMTQVQLAEALNITNKSVSKWENGICLPDSSLFEPLCDILGVTINELFAGRRIADEDYKKVADANLLRMLKYKLYCMSDKSVTFVEFSNALTKMAETSILLKSFGSKDKAVEYLAKETKLPEEECIKAYDYYERLFNMLEL